MRLAAPEQYRIGAVLDRLRGDECREVRTSREKTRFVPEYAISERTHRCAPALLGLDHQIEHAPLILHPRATYVALSRFREVSKIESTFRLNALVAEAPAAQEDSR